MTLAAGTKLGVYEIVAAIGAGGMGEVYKARDTRLARDVAIKVLPADVAADHDRLARFEREAQVLASLNHPNIAQIHGVDDSSGTPALVMELVEGPTLANRIAKGPIPVDEALPIAKQIAEALEAAHEQGIIHRDLKPANIKVRADGAVKVLDFGLAKAFDPVASAVGNVTMSPTLSMHATHAGIILGTAAYMAPEQARGRPVDRRADIWAFGCVLYEMLTGTRAFDGDDVSATLAYVITKEPDWRALPAGTPIRFRQLLSRCLKKDPKERLQWIGDARIEVAEDLGRAEEPTTAAGTAGGAALSSRWRRLPWWGATTAVVLVTAAYVVVWTRRTPAAPPGTPSLHLETSIGADTPLMPDGASVTMSEDGSSFVFVGGSRIGGQLYLRRLGELRATPLMGTAGSRDPFFSPDGRSIGFFASGKLKKMTLSGGAPVTVCDVESGRGGSWGDDGFIVFANASGGMMRVSAAGGTPEPVTHLGAGEVTHRWPQVLPESKALVYTAHSSTIDFENAVVMIQPLPGGTPVAVQRGGYYGRIFPSGHLVYVHQGALFAVPFDLARLRPAGEPVSVIDGIRATAGLGLTGSAQMAWSTTGTFMYVAGEPAGDLAPVQWLDRTGRVTPLRATPTRWVGLHFSPDGTRLAMGIEKRIWVYEWSRDAPTALTVGAAQGGMPVWSPDGHRIAFASIGDRVPNLYWQRADGSGEVQRLTDSPNQQVPGGFHPSGKFLVFSEQRPQTNDDLMILPIDGDEASGWKAGTPTVFLSTQAVERMPTFSPDGKWIAYTSTESGRGDVFVRPFPMAPGKWLISTAGGMSPVWSPVRSEILYVQEDQLMVVPYTVEGASFKPGQPHPFADGGVRLLRPARHFFALHPDGERVALALVAQESSSLTADKLVIMTNFFDELRRLAPPSKK